MRKCDSHVNMKRVTTGLGWALLALLVAFVLMPRPRGVTREEKEADLRGNLTLLRNAIADYKQDAGQYPTRLADLYAPTTEALGITNYHGPYLRVPGGIAGSPLPRNPFVNELAPDLGDVDDVTTHWRYDAATGKVHSAVEGATRDGQDYSAL